MGIEILGGLEIHQILTKLGPRETAIVGCVSHHFQGRASDDSLWSQFCAQELHLYSPEDPLGNPTPSFKAAYQAWSEAFSMYPWSLVLRVRTCWEKIRSWLVVNFPEAMTTLHKGATEDVLNNFESSLKVKLPIPTRLLYRFCDGQDLVKYSESFAASLLGLIGGYSFGNSLVNVFLLPLDEVLRKTNGVRCHLIEHVGVPFGTEYLVVATSSTERVKFFFLNCSDGQLFVGDGNFLENGNMLPCVPDDLIHSVHNVRDCQQQDGLLLWLEEHGRHLESGLVNVSEEKNTRYISLLPEESSLCYSAVENGVKVRASALFIPELSMTVSESNYYWFAFSIRMALNPGGFIVNGTWFDSCQLCMAHWTIQENNDIVNKITEETVDGKNPILHPGDEEFTFQVHICIRAPQGSLEGSLTFVPGRLTNPKGAEFEVELPQILLEYPDYIF
ncbi:F-box protein SKIP16 [Heracleum sosnowskyi]|uniref:F-box protein SKIP16 n=1 Tax=Heracleum sosnowskyi TaxID=360622 RepID=A0AAD8MR32_9APIA|nr:F-box protein SKIP16 [Heracleum sosnowskyi]